MLSSYTGCLPGVVKKDAKYSVIKPEDTWVIRLVWPAPNWIRVELVTTEHANLVARINQIKLEATGSRGGGFYIDEWSRVLVPTVGFKWYFGGTYGRALRFRYRDIDLQPCPPDGIHPGESWQGPRVGIPYKLTEDDVWRWCLSPSYDRQDETRLSVHIGKPQARKLAQRLVSAKGRTGRIYINQCKAFFAPIESASGWYYRFLGSLDADRWFPAPA